MKVLIIITLLILLASCNKGSSPSYNTPTEYDKTHSVKVNLKYAEPIAGYNVTVTCFVDTTHNTDSPNTNRNHNAIVGRGYINFKNDSIQFTVENPLFSDFTLMANSVPLINEVNITAKYTPFSAFTEDDNMIFNGNQSPFFFYDIDFDGEKELIVTLWEGMEYHGHNSYEIYKIRNSEIDEILTPLTMPPFNRIDDYTQVDSVAKTISICKGIDAVKIQGYDIYSFK